MILAIRDRILADLDAERNKFVGTLAAGGGDDIESIRGIQGRIKALDWAKESVRESFRKFEEDDDE